MGRLVSSRGLYDALIAEGFELPKRCREVELKMPTDGAFELHYTVFVENDELAKLGRALARVGDASSDSR